MATSLLERQQTFGASSLKGLLRGGGNVPNTAQNAGVPTSLPINLSQLAGASNVVLSLSLTEVDGNSTFNPKVEIYTMVASATATAHPAGSSGYRYQWSFTNNPYGCTLSGATSQTCTISYSGGKAAPPVATVKCVVTDSLGNTKSASIGVGF